MTDEIPNAVQKATEAAQAIETARQEQLHAANLESEKRILESLTNAIKEAFRTDTGDEQKKFIDITRIPLICHDIAAMKVDISAINDNLKWAVRIVIGGVITVLGAIVTAGLLHK